MKRYFVKIYFFWHSAYIFSICIILKHCELLIHILTSLEEIHLIKSNLNLSLIE